MIMIIGALLVLALQVTPNLWLIVIACTGLSMGCGFIVTLGIDMVVSSAPHEQSGAASGISESSTTFGSAFGVALLGSAGTAVYHARMTMLKLPHHRISDESKSTLSGALEAATNLYSAAGMGLREYARASFVSSFHISALVAAGLLVITMLIFAGVVNRKSSTLK